MRRILLLVIIVFVFIFNCALTSSSYSQPIKIQTESQMLLKVDSVMTRLADNFDILVLDIKNIKESLAALKTDFTVMQNDYMTFKKNDWPIISNKVDSYVMKQTVLENEIYNLKTSSLPEIKNRVDNLEKNLGTRTAESSKTDTTLSLVVSILGAVGTVLLAFFIKNKSEKQ
jgi:hypothetical protein